MISVEMASIEKRTKGGRLGKRMIEVLGGEIPTFDTLRVIFSGQDIVTRDEVRRVFEWDSDDWAAIENRRNPNTVRFLSSSLMHSVIFQRPNYDFSTVTYLNPEELIMDKVEERLAKIARRFDSEREVNIRGLEDAKRDVRLLQAYVGRENLLGDGSEQEGGEES